MPVSKLQAQILLFFYLCLSLRSGSNFQKCKIGGRVAIGIIILDVVFFLVFLLTQVKKIVFSSWWGSVFVAVTKISASSVIDRLRSESRGLLLVRECRGMKNPFAKKGGGD